MLKSNHQFLNPMPFINPILIQIGPIAIHWYGLMYVITFLLGYLFLQKSRLGRQLPLNTTQKDNLLITLILGIILGGRLGYILFYNLSYYLQNPLKIIAIWEGGLSFHGGVIGTAIAIILYIKFYHRAPNQTKLHFLNISDFTVLIVPIGIFLGRIGNFINSELYGRISPDHQFCLNFPTDPTNCRYPSQLIESFSEGLLLFIIIYFLSKQAKITAKRGRLTAIFLILYGLIRTIAENFREPDAQIGYLFSGIVPGFVGISLGQVFSILTILTGVIIMICITKRPRLLKIV